jgi:hypothetical protein
MSPQQRRWYRAFQRPLLADVCKRSRKRDLDLIMGRLHKSGIGLQRIDGAPQYLMDKLTKYQRIERQGLLS